MSLMLPVTILCTVVVGWLASQVMSLYGESLVDGVDLLLMTMAAVAEAIGYGLSQHFSSSGAM